MPNLQNYCTTEKGRDIISNGEWPAGTINLIDHRLCKSGSLDPCFNVYVLKGVGESFLSKYPVETEENNINFVVTLKQVRTRNGSDGEWQALTNIFEILENKLL